MTTEIDVKMFCVGLGLGVAAGFLWAPKSGVETRRFLQGKAQEGTDYVIDQANTAVNTAVNAAADMAQRGSKSIKYQKDNVAAAMEAGKSAYREAVSTTPNV